MNTSNRPQLFRRDFLFGATAGVTAGAASWLVAPVTAHEAMLPETASISYAQQGEDLILASLFKYLKIDRPSYIDIGAFDPIIGSNTYGLWKSGSRGVLVEPNPELTAHLQRGRAGDKVLPIGIGVDDTQEADFYMFSWPQLNTFDKETADNIPSSTQGKCQLLKVIKVPLVNINRIITEELPGQKLDLLAIDAEGFDYYILKSLDFAKHRPAIIITEHSQHPARRQKMIDLLESKQYSIQGQTLINTIFVDNERLPGE